MAPAVPALISLALGAGTAVYTGETQRRVARKQMRQQQQAQSQAEANVARQRQENALAFNKANAKKPNIAGLLSSASQFGTGGLLGTNLTGPLRSPLGGS